MPLYLRATNYSGGTNLNGTLTYSQLDGNFIYLDQRFETGSFTGSLYGTASWSNNSVSSSNALTASYVLNAVSSSFSVSASRALSAVSSSYPFRVTGSSIISHNTMGSSNDALFIGSNAGYISRFADRSIFIGLQAGRENNGNDSICIGSYAGYGDTGVTATNAIWLGNSAGYRANSANSSIFIGQDAGRGSLDAYNSIFIGYGSGYGANGANNGNFIGIYAGYNATIASNSTLIGYQVGRKFSGNGVGRNNIIVGTNITLENDREDSLNIAGLIFGTGSYYNLSTQSSGSANGRIGINVPNPQQALDVSGSFRQRDGFVILPQVSASLNFVDDAAAATGGVPLGGLYRSGSFVLIRLT